MKSSKKSWIITGLSLIFISVFFLVPVSKFYVKTKIEDRYYVTGRFSKYCYPNGYENGNIKKKFYYKSLEDCGKPLN